MKNPKVIIEVYGAMLKAAVAQKADQTTTLRVFTMIVPALKDEILSAFKLLVSSSDDGEEELQLACLDALKPVVTYLEDIHESPESFKVKLISIPFAIVISDTIKSIKANAELLYCTAPLRSARIEIENREYFQFDRLIQAVPKIIRRFNERNNPNGVVDFLKAVKEDAKIAFETGQVKDPAGYQQLMGVLSAQLN